MDSNRHNVHTQLSWENSEEILKRFESGDHVEATRVYENIAHWLAGNLMDSDQSFRQVPAYICDFLTRRIFEMLKGIDANHAFKLVNRKGGRPRTLSHNEEKIIANIVYDLHKIQGISLLEACSRTEEMLHNIDKELDIHYETSDSHGKRPLQSNPNIVMKNIIDVLIRSKPRIALDEQIKKYYLKHKASLKKMWACT